MSYRLIYKEKGFILTFSGDVSFDELNTANGKIQGHSEFDVHRYQIVDVRNADLSSISRDQAREPAAIDMIASTMNPKVRIGLIASTTDGFNICKEYADNSIAMGSPWQFNVFYDYDKALEWAKSN